MSKKKDTKRKYKMNPYVPPENPRKEEKKQKLTLWGHLKKYSSDIGGSGLKKFLVGGIVIGLTYCTTIFITNIYQNPYIDFVLEVKVFNNRDTLPIKDAIVHVADMQIEFVTNEKGIGRETFKIRKNTKFLDVSCEAKGYLSQEKSIHVPIEENPFLSTGFILKKEYDSSVKKEILQ